MLATDTLTLFPAPYWDRRLSAPLSEAHSAQRLRAHGVLAMASSLRFVLGRWLGRAPLLSFGGGFSTSSLGMWSSRRCRRGELTLGWCVPAPREDFTAGWWRQASAVRYGLARRLPRGGHDLTSASWSTFTDLIPFHALFETIQLPCLLLVTFSSHGSERSPGRPRFAAEGPKRSEGVSQPEPRRPYRRRAVLGWTNSAEDDVDRAVPHSTNRRLRVAAPC